MTEPPLPPFFLVYRHHPTGRMARLLIAAFIPIGLVAFIYFKTDNVGMLPIDVMLLAFSFLAFVRIAFLRSVILIVEENQLLVIRRPLIRIFGRYDIYPAANVRGIRYRSDVYHRRTGRIHYDERCYMLDLITPDERSCNLIVSTEIPLPRDLGKPSWPTL